MERIKTAACAALAMLMLAGFLPHPAFADGDKGKDKKKGPVIIGTPIVTNDPPKKK